ncbi:hypothetical protein TNCV_2131791 [Trichonephila clavipes]|nr:hypothetical protein TNCV_2131791 [Trichonephila clavipes]
MATGSSLTQNYSRSQSEIQGDLHKFATRIQSKWGTLELGSKKKFLERWIERGSPITWTLRYLVITSLDFLLEYVKNIVYQSSISSSWKLKSGITAAIQIVDSTTLHRTWSEISLDSMMENKGKS